MVARRVPAQAVPVDARSAMNLLGYPNRPPLLTIATARPALLVTLIFECPSTSMIVLAGTSASSMNRIAYPSSSTGWK